MFDFPSIYIYVFATYVSNSTAANFPNSNIFKILVQAEIPVSSTSNFIDDTL